MKEQEKILNTNTTSSNLDRTLQSIRRSSDKAVRIELFTNTLIEILEKYDIEK